MRESYASGIKSNTLEGFDPPISRTSASHFSARTSIFWFPFTAEDAADVICCMSRASPFLHLILCFDERSQIRK